MSEKIYAGSGKQLNGKFGVFRKIAVGLSDLPKEHIYEYNGKKYINLIISDKAKKDKYGKDVSVMVDTWKPDGEGYNKAKETAQEIKKDVPDERFPEEDINPEDIPF